MKKSADTRRIDALEKFIKREALVLWSGDGAFPGTGTSRLPGLALTKRSMRKALDVLVKAEQKKGDRP